jgi:XapX domain-containing protein
MTCYLVSLLMGLVVGVAYGLVQARCPVPPPVALDRSVGHRPRGAGGQARDAPSRSGRKLDARGGDCRCFYR